MKLYLYRLQISLVYKSDHGCVMTKEAAYLTSPSSMNFWLIWTLGVADVVAVYALRVLRILKTACEWASLSILLALIGLLDVPC
jgi:hypothetical protein